MSEVLTRRNLVGAAAMTIAAVIFEPPLHRDYEARQAAKAANDYELVGTGTIDPSSQATSASQIVAPALDPAGQLPAGHRRWLSGYSGNMTSAGKAAWLAATGFSQQVLLNFYDQQTFASVDNEIGVYGAEDWYMPAGGPDSGALSIFTMGLVPGSGPAGSSALSNAAAGDNDADWLLVGHKIADAGMDAWSTVIRLGHEMNANYYPWGVVPPGSDQIDVSLAAHYKDGWKRAVDAMRRTAPNIRFELCMNGGGVSMQPNIIYPGDDHVDIVGFDGYGQTANMAVPNFGNVVPFVADHNKKFAISEWGPGSGTQGSDDPTAVQQMFDSLVAADAAHSGIVSHDCYYDQGSWQLLAGNGQPGLPQTAAKIKELWNTYG